MAFTPYHNIDGSQAQDNELVAIDDILRKRIKSLQITNTDDAAVTVDLYIVKDSTDTASGETYYFLKGVVIPENVSLILDDPYLLSFDNSSAGYSLYISVGSSDTVDVIIKK